MRPILHDIVDHPFFTDGTVPSYIPTSAHDAPPDFRRISRAASQSNLRRLRRYSLLDEDQATSIAVPRAPESAPAPSLTKSMTSSIAQQEKEFQRAVQPGSPISALLSSARQPLLMTNNNGGGAVRESPLLRKLQAVKESPLGRRPPVVRGLNGITEEDAPEPPVRGREEHQEEGMKARKKELEAQKARIVAQMAPVREEEEEYAVEKEKEKGREKVKERIRARATVDRENVPPPAPVPAPVQASAIAKGKEKEREKERARERDPRVVGRERPALPAAGKSDISSDDPYINTFPLASTATLAPPVAPQVNNGFDAAAHVLSLAFDAKAAGKLFRDPREDADLPLPDERVFIVSWVDYCNKYGMGYALTDGSVGVHFNDSTSLVLSADKQYVPFCFSDWDEADGGFSIRHFDYITSRRQGTVYVRKSHTVDEYPDELKSKVYLLKHFERYIMDRLYGEYDYTFDDVDRTKGMEWVQKYLRMKHVIVFKLSHDVLQVCPPSPIFYL